MLKLAQIEVYVYGKLFVKCEKVFARCSMMYAFHLFDLAVDFL